MATLPTLDNYYRYPAKRKRNQLIGHSGFIYTFACGHAVTDSVFMDMVNCKTGVANWNDRQGRLF